MLPSPCLLAILLSLSLADAVPDCAYPAPPSTSLPSLLNCLAVVSALNTKSRLERNVPRTWARYPPAVRGVQLPATFSARSPNNDCEFGIDVVEDRLVDIFPTYRIAQVAGDLVHYCLLGTGPEARTIGNDTVSPRRVVKVSLRKKVRPVEVAGNSARKTEYNISGTKVLLMENRLDRAIT